LDNDRQRRSAIGHEGHRGGDSMIINRVWAMPNSSTFKIKPIKELLERNVAGWPWVDPFARESKWACISNDINENFDTMFNRDALEFLQLLPSDYAVGVLFDPPYSLRQLKECYDSIGVCMTQRESNKFWSDIKKEIARILKPGGVCISFGWNSGGIGKTLGFEIEEILLVPHGGPHNDTICTLERKVV
tara:strand:- start:421 stop:987 length:567 start_codon:yes stop_codon:yes gene_type:complete